MVGNQGRGSQTAKRVMREPMFSYTEAGCAQDRCALAICRHINGRTTHQAVCRAAGRERCARSPAAPVPAQSNLWAADSRRGDLRVVALAYQSQVDLPVRLVAAMKQGSRIKEPESEKHTENTNDPLVVILLGPTGSGKTALSLALAEHVDGEIVGE